MTGTLSERADALRSSGVPFVQATVVRDQEPSSARPGDRAIILSDGSMEGFVGGHCAAGSVRTAALDVLGTGESMLLRVLPDGQAAFPESPGAVVVVNPCLSGGAIEDTSNGKTVVNRWKSGDVEFEAAGSSHSARNVGGAIDVVLVVLKPQ